jgi:uncharacterized hydrophobic protein (TIGR00271 family)
MEPDRDLGLGHGATAAPRGELVDARQSLGAARLDDLFPEGVAFRRSLLTYTVLLALAALIASFGLYQDSAPSIIGAMVVAPLGGAIMALAAALVTGRLRWQTITFLQVVLGAAMVVAIGWLVAAILPEPLVLTPSLLARTSPGLLDLGVALAAGAAGAYVAARRTGADALPGVAIAVSLVPPLATVGICLRLGRTGDAGGAMNLFLTNFVGIVVVASIVFLILGVAPSREQLRERRRLRNGFVLAMIGLFVVAIPLAAQGYSVAQSENRATAGAPIVRSWIGSLQLQVADWKVAGEDVNLALVGPDDPPDAATLAQQLSAEFGAPVVLRLAYTPQVWTEVSANP